MNEDFLPLLMLILAVLIALAALIPVAIIRETKGQDRAR